MNGYLILTDFIAKYSLASMIYDSCKKSTLRFALISNIYLSILVTPISLGCFILTIFRCYLRYALNLFGSSYNVILI